MSDLSKAVGQELVKLSSVELDLKRGTTESEDHPPGTMSMLGVNEDRERIKKKEIHITLQGSLSLLPLAQKAPSSLTQQF